MPVLESQREGAWIVGTPSGAYRDLMTTRAIDDVDTAAVGWIRYGRLIVQVRCLPRAMSMSTPLG